MIRVMIKQAARKRGIKTPAELARATGALEAVAGRWWKAADKKPFPRLESLDVVCKALDKIEKCNLADLVKWVPEKKRRGNGHG